MIWTDGWINAKHEGRSEYFHFGAEQHARCRIDILWRYRMRLARLEGEAWRALVREAECAWAQEPDGGPWQTSCGNEFELIDGTPRDNGIAYCCYCGGSLEQIEYIDEAERDSNQQSQPVERSGS